MFEVHGSVQTIVRDRSGRVLQQTSMPVWFVMSEFLPDNSRMSSDDGKTWTGCGAMQISDEAHALRIAKYAILGDNADREGHQTLTIEATVSVRRVSANWPMDDKHQKPWLGEARV